MHDVELQRRLFAFINYGARGADWCAKEAAGQLSRHGAPSETHNWSFLDIIDLPLFVRVCNMIRRKWGEGGVHGANPYGTLIDFNSSIALMDASTAPSWGHDGVTGCPFWVQQQNETVLGEFRLKCLHH